MAGRNHPSSDREEERDDPFADLARIIGFDPRVKMQPAPSSAPPEARPRDEPAFAADEADELNLDRDFADFGIDLQATALPVTDNASRADPPDSASVEIEEFETSADLDVATEAFERAWEQTAQLSAELEASAHPVPDAAAGDLDDFLADLDRPLEDFEGAREAEPAPAGDALDADLDDVLAASIERDLGDAWLHTLDSPHVAPPEPQSLAAPEAEPQSATAVPPVPEERRTAAPQLDFEAELLALLTRDDGTEAEPEKRVAASGDIRRVENAGIPNDEAAPLAQAAPEPSPVFSAPLTPPVAPPPRPAPRAPALPLNAKELDDDPFAALAAMAERYRAGRPAPMQTQPTAPAAGSQKTEEKAEVDPMKRMPSARYEEPEIETFDVPERAVALPDDLDIPETDYAPPASRASGRNSVDAEFADLLEEMSSGEPVRQGSGYRTRQDAYFEVPRREAPTPARGRPQEAAPQRAADEWQPEADFSFDDESAFDEPESSRGARDDEPEPPRKRGRWLAALFGSVVIAGGAGAIAMKYTGLADVGGPIVVAADASPMKVRPENPGGSVVPNQDNEVYARVSGNPGVTPAQEKLLSSAEEPVSLDESALEDLPGLDMGEDIEMEEPAAKSEERVPSDAAEAPRPSEDPIAVVPRKVKTVAVRADGTIVAAEDEKPAVEALVASAGETIDKVSRNAVGVDTSGATTASVALAPADDQPAGPAGQASPAAPEPASLSEAQAAGIWSVQIASQPSEAAARSSYADLAGRYAAVLAGKSVNIVKADIAGKGTFWRVRVATETRSAAVDLCTTYKAAGGTCFVSK
jgi:hypothetical protein